MADKWTAADMASTDVRPEPARAELTDLRADGAAALEWAARYLERVRELPVLAQVAPGEIRARLPPTAPDDPEPFADVLRDLDDILLPGITHWQHPRFYAYFSCSSSEPAILAELLAATLNSIAILWRTAPAATELEGVVLDWVADLLGLPAGWHGHIEDSASTSTFTAIVAAREATGRHHRLLRARTLVGRQGGADARHAAAQGPGRRRVPHAGRGGGGSVRCRRHRRHRRYDCRQRC